MDPSRRISLAPVPSNLCSSLVVVKKSEASSSMHNVGVMVPVVPVSRYYAHTPPSTTQTGPITARPQSQSLVPGTPSTVSQPQLSLFRTMTYTPYPSEVSLSSLGRPWQMDRLWYTRNHSTFQMTDMHLWPPPPHCAMSLGGGKIEGTASMSHPPTLKKVPTSDTDKVLQGETLQDGTKKPHVRSDLVPSPAAAAGHVKAGYAVGMLEDDNQDDNQDDSSNDGLCLDEGCEMFDEDLEPLDLKVRPSPRSALVPEIVPAFPGVSPSTQHGGSHRNVSVATSSTKSNSCARQKERYSTDGPVDLRMRVMMEEPPLGAEDQQLRVAAPKRSNDNIHLKGRDFPDRNKTVPIKKHRRHKMQVNKPEIKQTKVMSVRICQKCKCDFRSTMFQQCPLCNASYIVENPSRASNSTLACLISLPAQLSLSQSNNRVSIVAKIELQPGTILGPLVGKNIDPKSAPTLSKPESIWVTEMATSGITQVLSTEDEAESNWLRYVLLGDAYYNTAIITRRAKLFFVSTETIRTGQELVLRPYNPLIAHLNSEHTLLCKECQISYTSPLYLANHRAIIHPRGHKVKSTVLTAIQYNTITLPRPEKGLDQQKPLCLSVKKKAKRASKSSLMQKRGVVSKQVDCSKCHQVLPTVQEVLEDKKKDDPDINTEPLKCDYCGKVFERKQSFRRHVISHQTKTETLPSRTCKNCGRQFYSSSNLKVHMLTHSGVKPFSCKLGDCAIGFTTKQSLQLHYIKRHGLNYHTMPQIKRNVPFTLDGYCHSQMTDGQLSTPDSSVTKGVEESSAVATLGKAETCRTDKSLTGDCGSIASVYDSDAVESLGKGQPLPGIHGESLPDMQGQPLPKIQGQPLLVIRGQPLPGIHGQPLPAIQGQSLPDMQGQPLP